MTGAVSFLMLGAGRSLQGDLAVSNHHPMLFLDGDSHDAGRRVANGRDEAFEFFEAFDTGDPVRNAPLSHGN